MDTSFPKEPGTYASILHLPAAKWIQVGKLGEFRFPGGYYAYVGSAFGPGGLAGRLSRHVALANKNKPASQPLHWHIDYLSQEARLVEIWFSQQAAQREHTWAGLIERLPGASIPALRFGASDCRCRSHLFHFTQQPVWADFQRRAACHLRVTRLHA